MPKKLKYTNKNKNKNINKNNIKININTSSKKRSRSRIQHTPKHTQPIIINNSTPTLNNGNNEVMNALNTFKSDLDELKRVKIGNFQNANVPHNTSSIHSNVSSDKF